MIIHGAHNSDTSDLYKNGKHVSKVIRNGKTIWQSGTYALLHNGAIGKLCKGHIDMVGPSGNVYIRDGSVYAREGADEYRITSTGDWPHGGADGDWPHSGDYLCKMVHTEYATGENWHLYQDEADKNCVYGVFTGSGNYNPKNLYRFQCSGNKMGTFKTLYNHYHGPSYGGNTKRIIQVKTDNKASNGKTITAYALCDNGFFEITGDSYGSPPSQTFADIISAGDQALFYTFSGEIFKDYGGTMLWFKFPEHWERTAKNYRIFSAAGLLYCILFKISYARDTVEAWYTYNSDGVSTSEIRPKLSGTVTHLTEVGNGGKPDFFAVVDRKLYEYTFDWGTTNAFEPVTLTGTEGLTQITDIVWDGTYGYLINDGKLYSFTHGGNPVLLDDTHVWEKVYTAGIAVAKS